MLAHAILGDSPSPRTRVHHQRDATIMIDSTMPVKLLPSSSAEFGIGVHCSAEDGALVVITPEAHVPHLDAHTGLWARYDLSPLASLVSVQLADLQAQAARRASLASLRTTVPHVTFALPSHKLCEYRPPCKSPCTLTAPSVGGRYTSRTRVHHATGESQTTDKPPSSVAWRRKSLGFVNHAPAHSDFRAAGSLTHISSSCALASVSSCGRAFSAEPTWSCDWTYGRRFQGLVMGSSTTNVIASVILSGPRAMGVIEQFRDITHRPSALGGTGRAAHRALGLHGDSHLAVQDVHLPSGNLVVARVSTESREDMHRLLHHCLSPLEAQLGVAPYARMIKASKTAQAGCGTLFAPAQFIADPSAGDDVWRPAEEPTLHVQHGLAWRR